jgi:hypothetical protein
MATYYDEPNQAEPERDPATETDAAAEREALANALIELDLQCQHHGLGTLPQVLAQIIRERHGLALEAV